MYVCVLPRFPHRKIECFAISPPGCTMSPELATAMSPFCYSLVHGKDIVPRISVRTVERLRDQMVAAISLFEGLSILYRLLCYVGSCCDAVSKEQNECPVLWPVQC